MTSYRRAVARTRNRTLPAVSCRKLFSIFRITMKVRDKNIKQTVSVADARCLKCSCYWPRPDPGVFTQGQGYRRREGKQEWLCGTREIRGCPTRATCCNRAYAAYETKCRECGHSLENA